MTTQKIILITGATGGIGKAAAIALARKGYMIVIHGRDSLKSEIAAKEIRAASGNDHVDFLSGDLFLLRDVKKIADEFKAMYSHLDVLINNAGGIMDKLRTTTKEGHEKTMALNVLAPFLLTNLLLDQLEKSEQGRIINVSSDAHSLSAKPDFEDLEMKLKYDPMTAYGNAKLYLIWNTQRFAVELEKKGSGVTANTLHPGAVATGFGNGSDLGWIFNLLGKLLRHFFKSPEQGASTTIFLASSADVSKVSGKYFVNSKIAKPANKHYSQDNADRVWHYCQLSTEIFTDQHQ